VRQVGGTVQTAGDIIAAISGIGTAGGAAINTDAATDNYGGGITGVTSTTTKVGTQTATYASTSVLDGTAHIMTHDTQVVDIVYQFLCGGGTSVIQATWVGIVNPINDVMTVQAWKHTTNAWETVGTIAGQTSTTAWATKNFTLYARHIGTSSAELGKVYLRFLSSAAYNHILRTDQVYVTYSVTSRTVGYADGAVWVKATGTAGTESYVNGTADNPCPWADAQTIATALGTSRFRILNGETVTLAGSDTLLNKSLIGNNWTLALENKVITNAYIEGATVAGLSSGDGAFFEDCIIGTVTLGAARFHECKFTGTVTTTASKDYTMHQCTDGLPGAGTNPIFLMAASVKLGVRKWSGGIDVRNLVSTAVFVIDGWGRLILAGTGAGGTVIIRGPFSVTDSVSGGFKGTIEQTERFGTDQTMIVADNQKVDVNTIKGRAVTDVGGGNTVYLGTSAWSTLTQTQVSGGAYDLTNATYVAALKSGLGTVPASGNWAIVGSLMGLADDAITAGKFDESTAFPVKSEDTGSTKIARVGADSDTLETLSDQLDTVSTMSTIKNITIEHSSWSN